jgi:hypothetical protein
MARLEQGSTPSVYEEDPSARNTLVQNEAIAYELAARFYAARGRGAAQLYLRNAREAYCWAWMASHLLISRIFLRQESDLCRPAERRRAADLATVKVRRRCPERSSGG